MTACRRCDSPLRPEDLRCAVCALPVPASVRAEAPPGELAQILRCHGCGAAVSYQAEVGAPKCAFCRAVMEVETPTDPIDQAERYVCFRVSDAEAKAALRAWLGSRGFFRPPDLQARAGIDELRPLWWVGWMFDVDALVSWAGDSNAGSRRSRWAPHAGQFPLSARNVVATASVGLTRSECEALVPSYRPDDATDAPPADLGATIERFSVQRSAARRIIADAVVHQAIGEAIERIPGSSYRKMSAVVLPTRLTSRHFAFPAWVLAYRYRDQLYRAVVHGQDADCVIGQAPIAWTRVALVVVVALVVIGLIVTWASAM